MIYELLNRKVSRSNNLLIGFVCVMTRLHYVQLRLLQLMQIRGGEAMKGTKLKEKKTKEGGIHVQGVWFNL